MVYTNYKVLIILMLSVKYLESCIYRRTHDAFGFEYRSWHEGGAAVFLFPVLNLHYLNASRSAITHLHFL